jgi:NAD(P)-dependent dehydrogenase (short-subunit alcohol dehydrogenase family)
MDKVIITGVNGQIGSELALKMLSEGYHVIGLDIKDTSSKINDSNYDYYNLDITSQKNVVNFFLTLKQKYKNINRLINNAGSAVFSKFEDRKDEELMSVTKTNMFAPIYMIQEFIKLAPQDYSASIVNIGSIYGIVAPDQSLYEDTPRNSSDIYGMTKAATINLTKYLAVYLKEYKIRCNCVSPGGVLFKQGPKFIKSSSSKVPLNRMADVGEIVEAVSFLLDNSKSSYINGLNMVVDGGFTSWR